MLELHSMLTGCAQINAISIIEAHCLYQPRKRRTACFRLSTARSVALSLASGTVELPHCSISHTPRASFSQPSSFSRVRAVRGRQRYMFLSSTTAYSFSLLAARSTRTPSSSCSATDKSGKFIGIILRGVLPGTRAYLLKSTTPA